MKDDFIIAELERNKEVFRSLLSNLPPELYKWKSAPDKWCLLEMVCHLYDEEQFDFRARLRSVLEDPQKPLDPIDPLVWVKEKNYMEQDYDEMLGKFISERDKSLEWLRQLKDPKWDNIYNHPKVGPLSARLFFVNWLAHDYFHIRQANRIKYEYLQAFSGESLDYAGEW